VSSVRPWRWHSLGARDGCRGRDRPRDPRVPPARPTSPWAPLPLPVDPFAGHDGSDTSWSSGPPPQPVALPSARLEEPSVPQPDPAQNPITYMAALMQDFSNRLSSLVRTVLMGWRLPSVMPRPPSPRDEPMDQEEPEGPLLAPQGAHTIWGTRL
jgi:hypothetical protein